MTTQINYFVTDICHTERVETLLTSRIMSLQYDGSSDIRTPSRLAHKSITFILPQKTQRKQSSF